MHHSCLISTQQLDRTRDRGWRWGRTVFVRDTSLHCLFGLVLSVHVPYLDDFACYFFSYIALSESHRPHPRGCGASATHHASPLCNLSILSLTYYCFLSTSLTWSWTHVVDLFDLYVLHSTSVFTSVLLILDLTSVFQHPFINIRRSYSPVVARFPQELAC